MKFDLKPSVDGELVISKALRVLHLLGRNEHKNILMNFLRLFISLPISLIHIHIVCTLDRYEIIRVSLLFTSIGT